MGQSLDKFSRTKELLGDDFEALHQSKVLLLGVGGVGGYCLDALQRSGIEDVSIVDFDAYELSNQNRQIGSEHVGKVKVDILHQMYPKATPFRQKVDADWVEEKNFSSYDLVIDAIDDMKAKTALALKVVGQEVSFISSMGGAKKLDPTRIKYESIWNTKGDALARVFRQSLRKAGFKGDFEVVYSDEEPKCQGLGSFVGVTGSFGLALASLAIKTLRQKLSR